MNWLGSILGGAVGETVDKIGSTIKKFVTTDVDRMQMQLEIEKLMIDKFKTVEETVRNTVSAKENIMVAELTQGDTFTKRLRPSIGYAGMLVIIYNYCVVPTVQLFTSTPIQPFELPGAFWVSWGGIMSVYSIGRSAEKTGHRSKLTSIITGS